MTDLIEIQNEPMNLIEIIDKENFSIEINDVPTNSIDVSFAVLGPKGDTGDSVDPNADFSLLYEIYKL